MWYTVKIEKKIPLKSYGFLDNRNVQKYLSSSLQFAFQLRMMSANIIIFIILVLSRINYA